MICIHNRNSDILQIWELFTILWDKYWWYNASLFETFTETWFTKEGGYIKINLETKKEGL